MQTRFRSISAALALCLAAPAAFAQAAPAEPAPPAKPPQPAPPPDAAQPAPAPAQPAPPAPGAAPAPAPGPAPAEPAPESPPEEPTPEPQPEPAPEPQVSPLPGWPEPGAGASGLAPSGAERAAQKPRPKEEIDVFAEDWWTHARPIIELHGYLRVRAELFYRFSLGRIDPPLAGSIGIPAMWPHPTDAPYQHIGTTSTLPALCTADEAGTGSNDDPDNLQRCRSNTQAGANIRFRLNPEIHVSDNLRIVSQIDILDNLVLGSTPGGYSVTPDREGGYAINPRTGSYTPLGFDENTTSPPRSGINSLSDSIHVKRAWGEYSTPVGELRFGRMPHHWGLGMVYHSGDGYDDDYQSTIDRLQFITGIKPLELYLSAAWDFPNEGPTSDHISYPAGQPFDVGQLDDVDQYVFSIARRKSPELQRLALARGELVVNGGAQLTYRSQLLANEANSTTNRQGCGDVGAPLGCARNHLDTSYTRRDARAWLPDVWVQLLYKKFRFEAEVATVQGKIGNISNTVPPSESEYEIHQWGVVTEIEQLLAEDRLKLGFGFGWASGDADVDGLSPNTLNAATLGQIGGDRNLETFRFNPSYRVDLILFRNILSRVQGTYYFRPSLAYDFVREPAGQRLGGSVAAIWSRASQFIQAPGHDRDLGVEFNAALYFQSKDGALNDDPNEMGGFYSRLEYGVLFPMAGLGYPTGQAQELRERLNRRNVPDASSAQTLRLYLGVLF